MTRRSDHYIDLPALPSSQYPTVATFTDLPDYAANFGSIFVVLSTTGIWPFDHELGFYIAGMSGWTYLSDFSPQYIKQLYLSNSDTNNFNDYYQTQLDLLIGGVATSNALVQLFDCDPDASMNSLVVADTVTDNKVLSIASNSYSNLVFGAIVSKPSPITCNVLLAGGLDGYSGLSRGQAVFVSLGGLPATTPPVSGGLQSIGIAISATKVSFNFSPNKISRP